ncbi:MAG: type II CAAX endopeptidase family protein [bacterium]
MEFAILLLSACIIAALVLVVMIVIRPPAWTAIAAGVNDRPWSLSHVGLLTATVLCGMGVLSFMLWLAINQGWQDLDFPLYAGLVPGVMFVHLPCLAVIRLVMYLEHISLKDGFGIEPGNALRRATSGIFIGMGTYPLVCIVVISSLWLFQKLELQGDQQSVAQMIKSTIEAPWYVRVSVVAIAVIIVPAVEELVFRGIALPAAARRLGFLPAAIMVSLVFAILHVEVSTYAPLFILSLALCIAYAHSGSMLVPFAMHATFNLIQIALLPFDTLQ